MGDRLAQRATTAGRSRTAPRRWPASSRAASGSATPRSPMPAPAAQPRGTRGTPLRCASDPAVHSLPGALGRLPRTKAPAAQCILGRAVDRRRIRWRWWRGLGRGWVRRRRVRGLRGRRRIQRRRRRREILMRDAVDRVVGPFLSAGGRGARQRIQRGALRVRGARRLRAGPVRPQSHAGPRRSLAGAALAGSARAFATWRKSGYEPPLLIRRPEWARATDVFPIEITDMRCGYEVLRGADPVAGLAVAPADLRQALEREFRGKLLRLRQGYVAAAGDPVALGLLAGAERRAPSWCCCAPSCAARPLGAARSRWSSRRRPPRRWGWTASRCSTWSGTARSAAGAARPGSSRATWTRWPARRAFLDQLQLGDQR